MPVYIPLNGPGKTDNQGRAKPPKAPAPKGWASQDYPGVDRDYGGWVGMRTDDLVVIDCDSEEAARRWLEHSSAPATYTVKTPRGRHFYYRWTPGSPTTHDADIFKDKSGVDIRAGRGSQVVVPPTPGYEVISKKGKAAFKPSWMPEVRHDTGDSPDEWTTIPEGRRDDTLMALAGAFRRQGMAPTLIYQFLQAMNETIVDQGDDPITDADLERITRSASKYDPQPDWSVEIDDGTTPDGGRWQSIKGMTLPPPPAWHWRPYIPKGRLVLLDGAEGIGKGLFCVFLANRITSDGGTVLWLSTEDDPEEDIQRRLLAAGYDRQANGDILFATVDPKFPTHTDVLEADILEHEAQIVILDPGRSFLAPPEGNKGMNFNDESYIRPGLEALNRLAKRTGTTILFVHHWNKNSDASVQYRAGGSGAFSQVVRHRLTLAWQGPTQGGEGAFEVSKSNIEAKGAVHGYCVEYNAEFDTAVFKPTERLEFDDIGAWQKYLKDEANTLEIDRTEELTEMVTALTGGTQLPTREELMETYGLKQRSVKELIADWKSDGLVRAGKGNKLIRIGEHER